MADITDLESQRAAFFEMAAPYIDKTIERAVQKGKMPVCVHQQVGRQPSLGWPFMVDEKYVYVYIPCYDAACVLPVARVWMSAIGPVNFKYQPG